MDDAANAFISLFDLACDEDGSLVGLTAAVKDIYDVAGHVTGCGSSDWARTDGLAEAHASPVVALLGAWARVGRKSYTDELAYSLMGVNDHYGTPINAADPSRVPGGSVRMPVSFCGVYVLRTTHGAIPSTHTMPLAPSFDTVGWFARDTDIMRRVAAAYGLSATVEAMQPALARLEAQLGPAVRVIAAPEGLMRWLGTFRVCQASEAWRVHGAWITAQQRAFGPDISHQFAAAAQVTKKEWAAEGQNRDAIRTHMTDFMAGGDAVMVLPSGPGPAPKRDADEPALNDFSMRALQMLCPAGLACLPQVSWAPCADTALLALADL